MKTSKERKSLNIHLYCRNINTEINMIKFFLILLSIYSTIIFAHGPFKMGAPHYPPIYNSIESNGYAYDIIIESFKDQGIEMDVRPYPIGRAVEQYKKLKISAHAPGKVHLPKNLIKNSTNFTYSFLNFVIFYNKENVELIKKIPTTGDNFDLLLKLKATTWLKSSVNRVLRKVGFKKIREVPNSLGVIHHVLKNRREIGVLDEFFLINSLRENFKRKDLAKIGIFKKSLYKIPLGISFNKKHPFHDLLVSSYYKGFNNIVKNGIYFRIFEKYFGKENVPKGVLIEGTESQGKEEYNLEKVIESLNQNFRISH